MNKIKDANRNTSVLALNEWNKILGDEFRKIVLWKNEFMKKINQVSFPNDVADFDKPLKFKTTYACSQLTKKQ